ncbi:ATP-dependent DNA helicase PIF1 [Brachionus plicatilis]|uniref:ATP-dependent DNA helicase PIF1 n=1 Tax=Brachionus plicatilis TaxID=10195 RepID=A0A3M7RLM2_BRAPC|nr:ATP-dependent DNA helicase PIF1 [Brachionus plicatilis]
MPEQEQALQLDKVKQKILWPNVSTSPVNEFNIDGMCSLIFPKLFPFGKGDPTKKSRPQHVTETQGFNHLLKYATKDPTNNQYYYPFAEHPSVIKISICDRISRHRTLDQTKVYFNQNQGDANLTLTDLKKMINDGSAEQILKRMTPYSANITGSNAYWYQRRCELETTFEQKKPATIFFTFSYADNHWIDLHRLLPGGYSDDPKVRYKNVLRNPHLVDWYFSVRLNEFLQIVFDGTLQCEWRWHRYEWQARSSIHAHGAARFKNDPGLTELTTKVYIGRKCEKELISQNISDDRRSQILDLIKQGKEAEETVIKYAETLLSATNPRTCPSCNTTPETHPCTIDFTNLNPEQHLKDYEDIINCVQRHVCRPDGYCKSKKGNNKCRFEFPHDLIEKTEIVFKETENTVIADIKLKRNDPNLNVHNIISCHHWRGNTDMQIILD